MYNTWSPGLGGQGGMISPGGESGMMGSGGGWYGGGGTGGNSYWGGKGSWVILCLSSLARGELYSLCESGSKSRKND